MNLTIKRNEEELLNLIYQKNPHMEGNIEFVMIYWVLTIFL